MIKPSDPHYCKNIWKLHRLPESIIMDREAQFAAGMIKELNHILGIDTKLSTVYYPQTCHDLAKWLSHYLCFFFFFFSFLIRLITTR